jgi:hypothetical protein
VRQRDDALRARGAGPAGEGAGEAPAIDVEAGEELSAAEGEAIEGETPSAEDPVDALLRQEQKERAKEEAASQAAPENAPSTPPLSKVPAAAPALKPASDTKR